ncbi:MAG: uroporphyrinogen-III C-methyltransferase, partial [Burkholderiales bacterium]
EADKLPMAKETRPAAESRQPTESQATGWRALAAQMWADVLSLVRIERVDASEPPLLAPDQAFFLRENLKLRLLSARLALLARDQEEYKADLQASIAMLNRYFDTDATTVSSSIDLLNSLAESNIVIELPDVSASLEAVRKYRLLNGAAAQ